MDEANALLKLTALAQATRLAVVLVLARTGGMASGEIADAVGVQRNLMSSHLAVLSGAGLVASERDGRVVTYRLRAGALAELSRYVGALGSRAGASAT